MNEITPLKNPFQFLNVEIRMTLDEQGSPLFCAKDVFEALGITWKGKKGSLINTPEEWQAVWYLQTPGGVQEVIFISEAAVYQTAFASRKPEAKKFAKWVCEEVLPAIRKQGFYGKPNIIQRTSLSRQLVVTTKALKLSRDAFEQQILKSEVHQLCNLLSISTPDFSLLGQDPKQLPLLGE